MPDNDINDILILEEAMKYLKLGRNSVLRLASQGEIPAKKSWW